MAATGGPSSAAGGATAPRMELQLVSLGPQLKSAGETLEFRVNNVESAFVNGLRRIMLAEIPVLAIERVTVTTNTSCFHDEMIAHRLGLVPLLSTFADRLAFPHDCACSGKTPGCEHCQIQGSLRVRCDVTRTSHVVTSKDLRFDTRIGVAPAASEDGIWLLTLGRGQELDVDFVVMKGIAKMHAKYMAVGTVAMRYTMDIRLNDAGLAALDLAKRRLWVERCPAKVFAIDEVTQQTIVADSGSCIYCRECLTMEAPFNNLPAPLVAVRPKVSREGRHSVTFTIETTGVLPAVDIVRKAVAVLRAKLVRLSDALDDEVKKQGLGNTAPAATRGIGYAPTAPIVPNADYLPPEGEDDVIGRKSL